MQKQTALPLPSRVPHKDDPTATEREWAWGRVHRLAFNVKSYTAAIEKHIAKGWHEAAARTAARTGATLERDLAELGKLCEEHGFPIPGTN